MFFSLLFWLANRFRRHQRNEQCVCCNNSLTFARKNKCFWCWVYGAEAFDTEVLKKRAETDKVEKGSFDATNLTWRERWDNYRYSMEKSIFGFTKEEVVRQDAEYRAEKGIRPMKKNRKLYVAKPGEERSVEPFEHPQGQPHGMFELHALR